MYVIGIYDIKENKENRVNKVRKVFDKYLNRCQNSVYEGNLQKSKFKKLEKEIKNIVNKVVDSVIFFCLEHVGYVDKKVLGIEKHNNNYIL